MILDIYKDAFEYSAKDWKALIVLGVMCLFSFLIIPAFLIAGYGYRVENTAVHGIINGNDPLPEFDDIFEMFIEGVKVFLVQIAYLLVPMILFILVVAIAGSIDGSVTYGTVKSGETIKLHQNEKAVISSIPAGTYYKVTELTTAGYVTTVNGKEGYIVAGTIENGKETPAAFVNKPCYELPNTGGTGTIPYAAGGILLISASGFLLYIHIKRRKEGIASS